MEVCRAPSPPEPVSDGMLCNPAHPPPHYSRPSALGAARTPHIRAGRSPRGYSVPVLVSRYAPVAMSTRDRRTVPTGDGAVRCGLGRAGQRLDLLPTPEARPRHPNHPLSPTQQGFRQLILGVALHDNGHVDDYRLGGAHDEPHNGRRDG